MLIGVVAGLLISMKSNGQAKQVLPPGHHEVVLQVDGLERRCLIHLPPVYDKSRPVPLVVMLHGMGGTATNAMEETGWSAKADAESFIIAYPDATRPDAAQPPRLKGNAQAWNDGSGRFHAAEQKIDDIAFLRALLDRLSADYAIDSRRVFFTGFSNGASMSFRVGAELGDRVAAIAPHSGSSWLKTVQPARAVSVCYLTGTADSLNPLEGGFPKLAFGGRDQGGERKPAAQAMIDQWSLALSCPEKSMSDETANGVRTRRYGPGRDGVEVTFITIEGLGHNWAGGKSQAPEFLVGKNTDKLKATDVVWEFFRRHPQKEQPVLGNTSEPSSTPIRLAAGDHTRTIRVGELQRRYLVHVPAKYDAKKPASVVIVFHGGGGNPETMVRLTGLNAKADDAGFLVVYPFGTGKLDNYFLTFNGGECCGHAMQEKIDDVGFTRAMLDDLATVANVDADRVFATGLSNGGIMAYRVAAELSDRIAAIAPVGGPLMLTEIRPSRPVPVMHFHGTADEFAPFKGGFGKGLTGGKGVTDFRSVEFSINTWVKANGCRQEPVVVALPDKTNDGMKVTRKTWSGQKDSSEVILIEIENGGHTWPGQKPIPAWLGKSTTDISANDLMWEFFQSHPLRKASAQP